MATADVSNDVIRCGTVLATVSFRSPLRFVGLAAATTIRIRGKLDGCVDVTNPLVMIDSGSFQGTLTGASNDCLALTTPQTVTGSLTYKWKANAETPISPEASVQAVNSLSGESFIPALTDQAFSGVSYLALTLG